ncbi:MAG: c-type cytochrome [Verrucomicrobiales bacterium]|nr:c-type cytochrome [Verrucomicrobiales bacterium]
MNRPVQPGVASPAFGPQAVAIRSKLTRIEGWCGSRCALHLPGTWQRHWVGINALRALALVGGWLGLITLPLVAADYLSPTALGVSPDGGTIYVACATAGKVLAVDAGTREVRRSWVVGGAPTGIAVNADGSRLYVTCAAPESWVTVVDPSRLEAGPRIPTGHTAMAPVLSADGRSLFVCCRFNDRVEVVDLQTSRVARRLPTSREPVAAALTPDGRHLFVAHHLPSGRSDAEVVACSVSMIDVASGRTVKEVELPNGSTLLHDIRVSPDGRYLVVTHSLARYHLPTTQVDRGWINSNAATLMDATDGRVINTVLLDDIDAGAANPWAAAWSPEGGHLAITHAGTHEVSVIDFKALRARLAALEARSQAKESAETSLLASRRTEDVPNDLSFLVGMRRRVRLPESASGPRAVLWLGSQLWVANYFDDSLAVVDVRRPEVPGDRVALGPRLVPTQERRGEALFNDATLCFQGWQSCASCHSWDGRIEGLNWDMLNDGVGNPKNSKSLLFSHETPPSMSLGVRSSAAVAVRAGIRFSMFTVQPPEVANALDAYLASLRPIPSPLLVGGQLSDSAKRGEEIFANPTVGCALCHGGAQFTDLKSHDVGTVGRFDHPTNRFDTPTLIEVWRTAPYLHDGRARTLGEVLMDFNEGDRHGVTSHLTAQEIQDLAAYVLSL